MVSAHMFAAAHPEARLCTRLPFPPVRIEVSHLTAGDREMHAGGALFLELVLSRLDALPMVLTSRDQTLTTFGFKQEDLVAVLPHLPPHAADRIVPVGDALRFDPVWDGNDLLHSFTRHVVVGGLR